MARNANLVPSSTNRPREFDPPWRIETKGRSISRTAQVQCALKGHWSNCDVYLNAPDSWFAAGRALILYAVNGSVRTVVDTADLSLVPSTSGGGRTVALVVGVRGRPCDGFEVETNQFAGAGEGIFYMECWGTESTPDCLGESLSDDMCTVIDGAARFPHRASHMLAYRDDNGAWMRVRCNEDGALMVSGGGSGGSTVVIGDKTPSDSYANPDDHVGTWSLLGGWCVGAEPTAAWQRLQCADGGILFVQPVGSVEPEDGFVNPQDAEQTYALLGLWNGATWDRAMSTNAALHVQEQEAPVAEDNINGVMHVHQKALATSLGAWSVAGSGNTQVGTAGVLLKNASGRIRKLFIHSDAATTGILMVFNKASAPVNGDTPVLRKKITTETDMEIDFGDSGLYLGTGLAIAFSTDASPDTLTLFATNDFHYAAMYL